MRTGFPQHVAAVAKNSDTLEFCAVCDLLPERMSREARARKVQTSLIEEFRYPKFGPGQLWETVANDVIAAGGEVRKQCDVTSVEMIDGRITAVRYREAGTEKRLEGDVFFSSMCDHLREAARNLAVTDVSETDNQDP